MLLVAAIFKGAKNAINALKSNIHVQYMVNGAKLQMQGILSQSDTLATLVGKISGILKCVEGSFTAEAMTYLEQHLTAEKGSRFLEVVRKLEKELGDKKTQLDTAKAKRIVESLDDGKSVDDVVAELKEWCESGSTKIYKAGFDEHLIKGKMGKGSKGVVGGHNFEEFKKAISDAGYDIHDCIINTTEHPTIKGIYEIEYRIPARQYGPTGELEIIPNQYKIIKYPKIVYKPSVISDSQMIQWGKEAIDAGIINGRNIFGYASNGLRFEGYIDGTTGAITNFYPVVE